jgi:hypothetical protein
MTIILDKCVRVFEPNYNTIKNSIRVPEIVITDI